MIYYRLIKPDWAKKYKANKENPSFIKEITGPSTVEGFLSLEEVEKLNTDGYNAYFLPNHPSRDLNGRSASGKDIDTFNFVFIDMDLKDGVYPSKDAFIKELQVFKVKPSIIVDSGNGIHAYWSVSNLNAKKYISLQIALIKKFKTDNSIWTILQLMRVPNTNNTKDYNNIKQCKIVEWNEEFTYTYETLEQNLPSLTEEDIKKAETHYNTTYLEEPKNDLFIELGGELEVPPRFYELLAQDDKLKLLFNNPSKNLGERSSADFLLAKTLKEYNFTRKEAQAVLFNTEKAKSLLGAKKVTYVEYMLEKLFTKPKSIIAKSIYDLNTSDNVVSLGNPVYGPEIFDCTHSKWRTKEILGLVGSPGVGKTTVSLKIAKDCLENNPDAICIYFSLEMTEGEIQEKFNLLTNNNFEIAKNLYVVSNEGPDGNQRHLNLQDIFQCVKDVTEYVNKKVALIVIDHVDIVDPIIDLKRDPNFGLVNPLNNKDIMLMDKIEMCKRLKELAKQLDCFMIIQSQTTKARAGNGDVPLGMGAAYGTSKFDWNCDYVMTCWQPLIKAQEESPIKVLAWSYPKIRKTSPLDKVQRGIFYLLKFEQESGNFVPLTSDELSYVYSKLDELRKLAQEEKKSGGTNFDKYFNTPAALKKHLSLIKND